MRLSITSLILLPWLAGCSVVGINTVEEASYNTLKQEDHFEVRLYDPVVIAETYVQGDFEQAGNRAFRTLFDYISGNNSESSKIAMTAPVLANQSGFDVGREIEMTVPVMEERLNDGWRYIFVLPTSYDLENAPKPVDDQVKLSMMPQKKIAVLRFSGTYDEETIDKKTQVLENWISANNLTAVSYPRWAGYNPPWTLPFFRRNEVMIDVN